MAYFDIENLSKIKGFKRENIFQVLRVAIILALAGVIISIVFFQEKKSPTDKAREEDRQQLNEEEKIKILESLSAPSDASKYTREKKKQILESLSAPQGSVLDDEEKKLILDSLNAL